MKPQIGIFAPCVGIGGGDQFFSSLVRFCREINFTGIHVKYGATFEQYERAVYQTGGVVRFHQPMPPADGRRHPACEYHNEIEDSCLAAAGSADAVISWHCQDTPRVAHLFPKPIIEVSQNEDVIAQLCGIASEAYASHRVAVSNAAGKAAFGDKDFNLIPNGIESDRCTPRFGRAEQRKLWAIPENGQTILFAGRMSPEKNPESLIDALGLLPDYFNLLFVGTGSLVERIQERASRVFPGRIRWIGEQENLGDAFAVADVFVLPSQVEGDSLAAKEAAAAGLPVVLTAAGSAVELNQSFGVKLWEVVPIHPTAAELADAIKAALTAGTERTDIVRTIALNNFTMGHISRRWEDFLQMVSFDAKRKILDIQQANLINRLQATPVMMFKSPRDKGKEDETPNSKH